MLDSIVYFAEKVNNFHRSVEIFFTAVKVSSLVTSCLFVFFCPHVYTITRDVGVAQRRLSFTLPSRSRADLFLYCS